jgi:hypothetical protein
METDRLKVMEAREKLATENSQSAGPSQGADGGKTAESGGTGESRE